MSAVHHEVLVVSTGVANTSSVLTGLRRLDCAPRLATDPGEVEVAPRVVLPGVGAYAAAMNRLDADGMTTPLRRRLRARRPTLVVCLGLQLLCEGSDESPGTEGLGILPARARRLPDTVRVPQIGWNRVTPQPDAALLAEGYAYFANSYCLAGIPAGWTGARADHGGPFVAALESGPVLACQFHPELSGRYGLDLMRRWLQAGRTTPENPAEEPAC